MDSSWTLRTRRTAPAGNVTLRGVTLRGATLRGVTLRGATLRGLCTIAIAAIVSGCATTTTTNTARTASEQVLISSAIDRAFSNVNFNDFSGQKVFVDEKYVDSVDKGYLISTLRHKVLAGGGLLAGSADDADLVLEARSGGVGTDAEESYIGIPSLGLPGLPIEIPEVKFVSSNTQMATAKVGLVCYDPKTGRGVGTGGATNAIAHNKQTYVAGVGPFRSGAVVGQRQRSVGFDGVGGSLIGGRNRLASSAVDLVDGGGMYANRDATTGAVPTGAVPTGAASTQAALAGFAMPGDTAGPTPASQKNPSPK